MTVSNIAVFIGGLAFTALGVSMSRFYKSRKVLGYVFLIIGILLIYITTIGPLSHATEKINEVVGVSAGKVTSIVIKPAGDAYPDLVQTDQTITDKEVVKKLCDALHKINVHDEGLLKNPERVALIQINTTEQKAIVFEVRKTGKRTTLSLDSKGTSGWHYAYLEAYDFGMVLDVILNN